LANAFPLLVPELEEVVVEETGVNTILFEFNDDDPRTSQTSSSVVPDCPT
jgi:hypothetical protein